MARKYDIVLYGASGYTGEYIAEELINRDELSKTRIALAGRNRTKLENVRDRVTSKGNVNRERFDIVIASNENIESLAEMAKSARLVINATGPYRFLGEDVVRACVNNGTDYIDISGEPEFLERSVMMFDATAIANGSVVIGGCGWDSIPSDMGVAALCAATEASGQRVGSVEGFLEMFAPAGVNGHLTTYECAVYGMGSAAALPRIRKAIDPGRFPMETPPRRIGAFPFARINGFPGSRYIVGFPGSDMSIVRRSQRAIAQQRGQPRGVGYSMYVFVGFMGMVKLAIGGGLLGVLCKWGWGRKLLLKFPSFFTFGSFTSEGPNADQLARTHGRIVLRAYAPRDEAGNEVSSARGAGQRKDVIASGVVSFPEPGYIATSRIVVAAAASLLLERDTVLHTLERKGGVVTSAEALRETGLWQRLQQRGIGLEISIAE